MSVVMIFYQFLCFLYLKYFPNITLPHKSNIMCMSYRGCDRRQRGRKCYGVRINNKLWINPGRQAPSVWEKLLFCCRCRYKFCLDFSFSISSILIRILHRVGSGYNTLIYVYVKLLFFKCKNIPHNMYIYCISFRKRSSKMRQFYGF